MSTSGVYVHLCILQLQANQGATLHRCACRGDAVAYATPEKVSVLDGLTTVRLFEPRVSATYHSYSEKPPESTTMTWSNSMPFSKSVEPLTRVASRRPERDAALRRALNLPTRDVTPNWSTLRIIQTCPQ